MWKLPTRFPIPSLIATVLILASVSGCEDDCVCPPAGEAPEPAGWIALGSVPTSRDLYAVCAMDVNTVVVAGDSGTVLRSADGGESWTIIQLSTDARLLDLSFAGADTGWVAGYAGAFFKTLDGGVSWQPLSAGTSGDLRAVCFVDSRLGWVAGGAWPEQSAEGMIARTEDGGQTWTARATDSPVNVLFAVDADTVCAGLSMGGVLRTTDGGQTWQEHPCDPPGWLGGIWFTDPLTGWLSGSLGALIKSQDGGKTWEAVPSGTTRNLVDITFRGTQNGWAVGQLGSILQTRDGGALWTFRSSGTTNALRMTSFADDETGWIVGMGGVILKTVTAGEPG